VLAVELLTAASGIELRRSLKPAPATAAVIDALRDVTPGPGPDRFLAPEIEVARQLIVSGGARHAAESITGPLL
jgi:histidine ammonia-lyase